MYVGVGVGARVPLDLRLRALHHFPLQLAPGHRVDHALVRRDAAWPDGVEEEPRARRGGRHLVEDAELPAPWREQFVARVVVLLRLRRRRLREDGRRRGQQDGEQRSCDSHGADHSRTYGFQKGGFGVCPLAPRMALAMACSHTGQNGWPVSKSSGTNLMQQFAAGR